MIENGTQKLFVAFVMKFVKVINFLFKLFFVSKYGEENSFV